MSPIYGLGWRPHRRVRLRYDDHYPVGASQHQKIIVIDGALAFCGGLDLTRSRWDTPRSCPGDARRINEGDDDAYAPFHDTMMAMDGEAATSARRDRARALGSRHGHPLKRVAVGQARTPGRRASRCHSPIRMWRSRARARRSTRSPICEVQELYLDMIQTAKRTIYIENQYFTVEGAGRRAGGASRRSRRPRSRSQCCASRRQGWLEAPTMGTLRTVLLEEAARRGSSWPLPRVLPAHPGPCRKASAATCIRSS